MIQFCLVHHSNYDMNNIKTKYKCRALIFLWIYSLLRNTIDDLIITEAPFQIHVLARVGSIRLNLETTLSANFHPEAAVPTTLGLVLQKHNSC